MTLTASLGKTWGNLQMGNRAKRAILGKRVGRERETGEGASLARKARRAGEKRERRVKGKVLMATEEEDKVVRSKQEEEQEEEQEKKVRGLVGGVGLKG